MKEKAPCRHCGNVRSLRPRGLCVRCYFNPAVREKHQKRLAMNGPEPQTVEEVEQMIAEQMKCLPSWWDKSGQQDREYKP